MHGGWLRHFFGTTGDLQLPRQQLVDDREQVDCPLEGHNTATATAGHLKALRLTNRNCFKKRVLFSKTGDVNFGCSTTSG